MRPILSITALALCAALTACGGGDDSSECPAPPVANNGTVLQPEPAGQRPVTYGTGAPWFLGPLQAAPAAVSAAAGQQMWVCP